MNRNQTIRREALEAAKELIESLGLSADEGHLVLGIALDKYESVCSTLEGIGLSKGCLSAVFAAALEYSETILNQEGDGADE